MLEPYNVRMKPSNVRKKSKGTTKYEKRTVTCDVGTVQCEDGTIKYEKKITLYNKLPISRYRTSFFLGTVELLLDEWQFFSKYVKPVFLGFCFWAPQKKKKKWYQRIPIVRNLITFLLHCYLQNSISGLKILFVSTLVLNILLVECLFNS